MPTGAKGRVERLHLKVEGAGPEAFELRTRLERIARSGLGAKLDSLLAGQASQLRGAVIGRLRVELDFDLAGLDDEAAGWLWAQKILIAAQASLERDGERAMSELEFEAAPPATGPSPAVARPTDVPHAASSPTAVPAPGGTPADLTPAPQGPTFHSSAIPLPAEPSSTAHPAEARIVAGEVRRSDAAAVARVATALVAKSESNDADARFERAPLGADSRASWNRALWAALGAEPWFAAGQRPRPTRAAAAPKRLAEDPLEDWLRATCSRIVVTGEQRAAGEAAPTWIRGVLGAFAGPPWFLGERRASEQRPGSDRRGAARVTALLELLAAVPAGLSEPSVGAALGELEALRESDAVHEPTGAPRRHGTSVLTEALMQRWPGREPGAVRTNISALIETRSGRAGAIVLLIAAYLDGCSSPLAHGVDRATQAIGRRLAGWIAELASSNTPWPPILDPAAARATWVRGRTAPQLAEILAVLRLPGGGGGGLSGAAVMGAAAAPIARGTQPHLGGAKVPSQRLAASRESDGAAPATAAGAGTVDDGATVAGGPADPSPDRTLIAALAAALVEACANAEAGSAPLAKVSGPHVAQALSTIRTGSRARPHWLSPDAERAGWIRAGRAPSAADLAGLIRVGSGDWAATTFESRAESEEVESNTVEGLIDALVAFVDGALTNGSSGGGAIVWRIEGSSDGASGACPPLVREELAPRPESVTAAQTRASLGRRVAAAIARLDQLGAPWPEWIDRGAAETAWVRERRAPEPTELWATLRLPFPPGGARTGDELERAIRGTRHLPAARVGGGSSARSNDLELALLFELALPAPGALGDPAQRARAAARLAQALRQRIESGASLPDWFDRDQASWIGEGRPPTPAELGRLRTAISTAPAPSGTAEHDQVTVLEPLWSGAARVSDRELDGSGSRALTVERWSAEPGSMADPDGWTPSRAAGLALLVAFLPGACADLFEQLETPDRESLRQLHRQWLLASVCNLERPEGWHADPMTLLLAGIPLEAEAGRPLARTIEAPLPAQALAVERVARALLASLANVIPGMASHGPGAIEQYFILRSGRIGPRSGSARRTQLGRRELDQLLERSSLPLGLVSLSWVGLLDVSIVGGRHP
ncbi:hypothetical protein [Engelhardtia mirabilis]|uniref:Uncharacterized protein n=1 Tax=Engelhardtia mirabilis TaxID=2528011 RepID=A0A518BPM7_9BACT|nr:hypothetical protein Pla133_40430 [Planctomycetes bacterium Pla133]QDV03255.1 hypothetical protein Pla86_40420 [Planctomycetes bacterium Pla86]